MLAFYSFNLMACGIILVGFSPVTPLMIKLFDVSTFATTLLVLVFNILGVPMNFPSNYLMDKYGV